MKPGNHDLPRPLARPLSACSSPVCVKGGCGLLGGELCKAVVLYHELATVSRGAEHGQHCPWGAAVSGSRMEA